MEGIELLLEDIQFFDRYRERFKRLLIERLKTIGDQKGVNIELFTETLFEVILHPDNPKWREKFKQLLMEFYRLNIPIRQLLSELFLDLLGEYIRYLRRNCCTGFELKKVRVLASALEGVIQAVDQSFKEYLQQLEQQPLKEEASSEETGKILELLKKSGAKTVELLAYYKVFPVLCRARLYKITDLFIRTSKCPYKIFTPGEKVYIKLPQGGNYILAKIVNVDGDYLVLQPLQELQTAPPKAVRVFPQEGIDAKIKTPAGELYGFIQFISFEEVGVITPAGERLKPNQKVHISFTLPTGKVETEGTVKEVKNLGGAHLVVIELELDPRTEQIISRYVLKRQQEILKELKV